MIGKNSILSSVSNVQILSIFKLPEKTNFDFVLLKVGGGTVGSVIANKLSSIGNVSVLLIEAGNIFGPLSIIPLLTTIQQSTSVDWAFRTVPQKYSSAGFVNQQQFLPRGKGLGGSSQLNYMLHYSDGTEKEFDKWEIFGGSEWGRENLMKYLIEDSGCNDDKATDVCIASDNEASV